MNVPLVLLLMIFLAGLLLGRKHPVVLASCVALALGVLVSGNAFGDFVRTLLLGAFGLIT